MKRLLLASAATGLLAGGAVAEEVNMALHLGFTGPLESMAPDIVAGAEAAINEVNESGLLLGGDVTINGVRSDTTCIDAAASVAAAERQVAEGARFMVGGQCSGETIAVVERVGVPNGVVMVSPSATSPALTTIEDDGLFFRTAPSDARQGQVMAELAREAGYDTAAITYTNNDYGKGLADSFEAAFTEAGGSVSISAAHDDGKADYSAEVGALAAAGGDVLVVIGYVDQGGSGITRASLDTGAFDIFMFPDGMVGDALVNRFGDELDGSIGINPASEGEGRDRFVAIGEEAGFNANSPYSAESYDAAALMMLAMQAAGSTDPAEVKEHIMAIANGPGEKIMPGELARGLELLAAGTAIDYDGASTPELVEPGENPGMFRVTNYTADGAEVAGYR